MTEVLARINHGRWIGDCSFCPSAEQVSPTDTEFRCNNKECPNYQNPLPLIIPSNYLAIQDVLRARPNKENKNWEPGETVADLKRENSEHGLAQTKSDTRRTRKPTHEARR